MHPETEIARHFWAHVNERGHGDGSFYPSPPALMALQGELFWYACILDDEDELRRHQVGVTHGRALHWFGERSGSDDRYLPPTAFPTLQDALYDFLIANVGKFFIASDYELWLRAVAQILADVVRSPNLLAVRIGERIYHDRAHKDISVPSPETIIHQEFNHTMVIGEDWSVLQRPTFDFASRNYQRAVGDE